jgi:hypothetical protein
MIPTDRDQSATASYPVDSQWLADRAAFWRKSVLLFAGAFGLLVTGCAIMLAQVPRGPQRFEVSTDTIVNGPMSQADREMLVEFRTSQKMEAAEDRTVLATGEAQ